MSVTVDVPRHPVCVATLAAVAGESTALRRVTAVPAAPAPQSSPND